jgi:hypothetical protein
MEEAFHKLFCFTFIIRYFTMQIRFIKGFKFLDPMVQNPFG